MTGKLTMMFLGKFFALLLVFIFMAGSLVEGRTEKPVLHGRHWMAITGKPLAATAGAKMFERGGNAVDASCAMLAAVCTMYDVLSWGGETQALIFNPGTGKVVGINALGVAPTGATPEFYKSRGFVVPPAYGPLAAVTPGVDFNWFFFLLSVVGLLLAHAANNLINDFTDVLCRYIHQPF